MCHGYADLRYLNREAEERMKETVRETTPAPAPAAEPVSKKRLAELTRDNLENLTMDMPCHRVFDAGQRKVKVVGPFADLETEIARAHEGFW